MCDWRRCQDYWILSGFHDRQEVFCRRQCESAAYDGGWVLVSQHQGMARDKESACNAFRSCRLRDTGLNWREEFVQGSIFGFPLNALEAGHDIIMLSQWMREWGGRQKAEARAGALGPTAWNFVIFSSRERDLDDKRHVIFSSKRGIKDDMSSFPLERVNKWSVIVLPRRVGNVILNHRDWDTSARIWLQTVGRMSACPRLHLHDWMQTIELTRHRGKHPFCLTTFGCPRLSVTLHERSFPSDDE